MNGGGGGAGEAPRPPPPQDVVPLHPEKELEKAEELQAKAVQYPRGNPEDFVSTKLLITQSFPY